MTPTEQSAMATMDTATKILVRAGEGVTGRVGRFRLGKEIMERAVDKGELGTAFRF